MSKFISSDQCTEPVPDCQGEVIEKVEEFRCLGSDLSGEGSADQAVRGWINAAWLKQEVVHRNPCDRGCFRTLRGKLYRTVVRPALLYGSECWILGEAQERHIRFRNKNAQLGKFVGKGAKLGC